MSELTQNRGQGWLMVARVTVEAAAAFFISAAVLNYGVACTAIGRWFGSVQLVPAAFALALPVLAFWLAVTLLFGRVYCSTVCPLGALIDFGARFRPQRKVYRFRRPLKALRLAVFIIALLLLVAFPAFACGWIEPFGLYSTLLEAVFAERVGLATLFSAAIAALLAIMAWRRGRLFCNSLCPLSAPLGYVARSPVFHIDIDTDRCIQCRKCADVCKAGCIDLQDHVVDMSRCVVCFNCLPVCPNDAIAYTPGRHTLSDPMMQKIKSLKSDKPTTSLACDNTSTSSKTSSITAPSKPTAPEPER